MKHNVGLTLQYNCFTPYNVNLVPLKLALETTKWLCQIHFEGIIIAA